MKRLILGFFSLILFAGVSAQSKAKYPIDAEGNCEIIDTIDINVTNSDCYRIIKEWLYTKSCVSLSFSNEKKNQSLTFNNVFYIQKRYNSFSGTYSDNLSIDCDMKIEGSKLIYRIYHINMIKSYVGYDATASVYPVAERIHKINSAQSVIDRVNQDKTLSKADKRDILDDQKEILAYDEVLVKSYNVLMERFSDLKKMVQWSQESTDDDTEEVPFP